MIDMEFEKGKVGSRVAEITPQKIPIYKESLSGHAQK
jgi:hypothetical protein